MGIGRKTPGFGTKCMDYMSRIEKYGIHRRDFRIKRPGSSNLRCFHERDERLRSESFRVKNYELLSKKLNYIFNISVNVKKK